VLIVYNLRAGGYQEESLTGEPCQPREPAIESQAELLGVQLGWPVILLGVDRGARSFDDTLSLFWFDLAERFPDKPIHPAALRRPLSCAGGTMWSTALPRSARTSFFVDFPSLHHNFE
jgi:hypothetical protein